MEFKLFLHRRVLPSAGIGRNTIHTRKPSRAIVAVSANPKNNPAITTEMMTVYNDSWFDRLAIRHITQSVQATTGVRNKKEGYEGFIEAATAVAKNKDPNKQQDMVIQALHTAFPKPILTLIRALLRPSKFTREFFAVFTTLFFPWLVGPCERHTVLTKTVDAVNKVRESELEGSMEQNVVYIKKCRFLEGTSCAGMCVNLCKMPSQRFIKDSFGIPVNMVPNFDDMSCEMIFGQEPPPVNQDPALKQPCYKTLCNSTCLAADLLIPTS